MLVLLRPIQYLYEYSVKLSVNWTLFMVKNLKGIDLNNAAVLSVILKHVSGASPNVFISWKLSGSDKKQLKFI